MPMRSYHASEYRNLRIDDAIAALDEEQSQVENYVPASAMTLPWPALVKKYFPSTNTKDLFLAQRKLLIQYGVDRLRKHMSNYIDADGMLTTGTDWVNIFARFASGEQELPAHGVLTEVHHVLQGDTLLLF